MIVMQIHMATLTMMSVMIMLVIFLMTVLVGVILTVTQSCLRISFKDDSQPWIKPCERPSTLLKGIDLVCDRL